MAFQQDLISALLKSLSHWQQGERLLRLSTSFGADVLLPESVDGVELIGPDPLVCGFRLVITALSTNAHLETSSLIGQPVLLELQTQASRTALRPFHGHIIRFERLGANGGFARYRLVLEPWMAMLAHNRDAFAFQDMTVIEIVDAVFSRWQGKGALVPAWRWDLADASIYPKRSLCYQYQESDLTFVSRLLAEEGIFYWVEHEGDRSSLAFGKHTVVLADHGGAFKPNAQPTIRFTRADATEKADSIQRWGAERSIHSTAVRLSSWDYRSLSSRAASAGGAGSGSAPAVQLELSQVIDAGQYAYPDQSNGERLAGIHVESIESHGKRISGAGTVRALAPATSFTLIDHSLYSSTESESGFAVLSVRHRGRNNFNEDIRDGVAALLGNAPFGSSASSVPHYRNDFVALPKAVPYRPGVTGMECRSEHARSNVAGRPRPNVAGMQSAVVVGPADAPIHTDRDGRVKIQFHWQRGSQSASRLAHPSGEDNAPASDVLGTWVRVGQAYAGPNFGSVMLPRVGQEVSVAFLDGNVDRPVITGVLYNGRGAADAQHNEVSAGGSLATGNAPAWFAGEGTEKHSGHAHNAVLSGFKTMEMRASQTGGGGYNQLVIDDTPGESGIRLATTQAQTALQLGHLKYHRDNARQADLGHGAELATAAWGAARGGSGVLISADARPNASGPVLDSKEPIEQLTASLELAQTLAQSAQSQNAKLKDEPASDKLPAIEALRHGKDVLEATADGAGGGAGGGARGGDPADEPSGASNIPAIQGGAGTVPAWSEPFLVTSAPAGIVSLTPQSATLNAGKNATITAGQDFNLLSQQALVLNAGRGLSLYTHGKATNANKPNQETGIKLHAASGKVSLQSQSDKTEIAADKQVTVASAQSTVTIAAPGAKLQLIAAGAALTMKGGDITLKAPGSVIVGGAITELAGPASASESVSMPKGEALKGCAQSLADSAGSGGLFVPS